MRSHTFAFPLYYVSVIGIVNLKKPSVHIILFDGFPAKNFGQTDFINLIYHRSFKFQFRTQQMDRFREIN